MKLLYKSYFKLSGYSLGPDSRFPAETLRSKLMRNIDSKINLYVLEIVNDDKVNVKFKFHILLKKISAGINSKIWNHMQLSY